jgi:type IV secretory pathway VirB10-like protein
MNRTVFAIAAGALFCLGAAAQSQTGAQAGAQSSSQASVQAGQTQAQASGNASASASASAEKGQANGSLASGTAVNAALSSPIDSKKCKPGDPVNARSTEAVKSEGKTVIPKGAKLVGHVTQASARAKGESESSLGIVFDKAILKNGEEIPLNVRWIGHGHDGRRFRGRLRDGRRTQRPWRCDFNRRWSCRRGDEHRG